MFFLMPNFAKADVNTVIADPNNVTDCGTLNQTGITYTLRNNVTSAGSCFNVIVPGVTLDLNGFTVTYDDSTPIVIPNGSFELGTGGVADNWDHSLAPKMQRTAGVFVKPLSVYSGDYALKIAVPAADQEVRSVGQVTLEANTTYTISAMMYNNYINGGYQSPVITLSVGLDDGSLNKTASKTGINWRGFQYTYKEFTTGNTQESYNVVAKISGGASAAAGNVFIDDIKIQKHYLSGIFVGPASWNAGRYPDVSAYGNAVGTVIKSGTVGVSPKGAIVQGQGGSSYSDAIYVAENSGSNFDFNNLEITTHGANSHLIFSYYLNNAKIRNNLLHHNVQTITSRDNYDGAAIYIAYGGDGGFINNNILDKGIQSAVYAHTRVGAVNQVQVHDNEITLQTKYTNDFAIVSGGSEIFKNTINCGDGNNSCRGIGIGGNGTETYENTINVQQLPRNQEYDGCCLAGAYGMQMESNTKNIKVYGNIVNANAGACEAYALRANPYAEGGILSFNNLIYDNIFTAIKNGSERAGTIKYSQLGADEISVTDNTFRTNDKWIYVDGGGVVLNPTFARNRWETVGTLIEPFRPLEVYTWAGTYFSGTFYDNTYGTVEDEARFESDVFRTSNGNPEVNSSFTISVSDLIAPTAPSALNVI